MTRFARACPGILFSMTPTSRSTVSLEREGPLALLRLQKPRANAIDAQLLEDLLSATRELSQDDEVRGVLLASAHPRVFCPGLDLVALVDQDREQITALMRRFAETVWALYGMEKPVVAALAGHAIAGGCVLSLTADYRVLARDGVQIGLNEIRVGVPLPWTVTLLLQASLPPQSLTRAALDGANAQGEDALAMGFAHELADADGFEEVCLERLQQRADREPAAFAVTKRHLRQSTLERMRTEEDARLGAFVDCWFSDGGQARIKAQVETLTRKKQR